MRPSIATAISFCVLASVSECQTAGTPEKIRITRSGSRSLQPPAAAPNFTGSVRIEPLFEATDPSRTSGGRVTFEPGARTWWHTHTVGQTLIVTAGSGRVQRWGDPVEEIREGDVVWIPPNQKHWHGSSPNSSMSHIAITEHLNGKRTEWMEQVSDSEYGGSSRVTAPTPAQPTAAQRLMGDIAPKLADLTDRVLFEDVWQRPQLSRRDRSLVTVAALIAMNRPDQLRSHLARARANGLTEEQLVEAITHLAFYSGWPNAVTAVGVARDVFKGSQSSQRQNDNTK